MTSRTPARLAPFYALATAVVILVMLSSAYAQTNFSFTYFDASGDAANGTLVGTDQMDGTFLATSGTLTVYTTNPANTNVPATIGTYLLVPGGPTPAVIGTFTFDDLLYPNDDATLGTNGGLVDNDGLLFSRDGTGAVQQFVNIFASSSTDYAFLTSIDGNTCCGGTFNGGTFLLPEPCGLGVLLIGGTTLLRRRRTA